MSSRESLASQAEVQTPPVPRPALDRAYRLVWLAYGVLGACLVAYVISELVRRDGQSWPWLDNWGVTGFELVLSGLCLLRGLLRREGRTITLTLGLGLLAWAAGDMVAATQSPGVGAAPPLSLADAFYLTFYPLTYVALVLLMRRQVKRLGIATWLDGAVAGAGAAALCAAFAFRHVSEYSGSGVGRIAVALAYPVGDLLLLGIVVAGSAVLPGRRKAPWLLLAVGYMLNALGDTSNLFHSGNRFGANGHAARCGRLADFDLSVLALGLAELELGASAG